MRKLKARLKSRRGETFVEIIIAILIVAFGCVMIGTLYSASLNMNATAREKDVAYYSDLNKMTASDEPNETGGSVEITDEKGSEIIEADVDTYGDDLTSYRKR